METSSKMRIVSFAEAKWTTKADIEPTCKNCMYCCKPPQTGTPNGLCRYNPPNDDGKWPPVRGRDFCGKWRAMAFYEKDESLDLTDL